jgi:hypothetical protein
VVHDATRGTDDNLGAAVQLPKLDLVVLTAIDASDWNAPHLGGIFRVGVGDLNRQFASRRQDQDLNRRDFGVEPVEGGKSKRGGLAGASLRLPQNVAALDQVRNRFGLNRSGLRVAGRFHGPDQTGVQTKIAKRITCRSSDGWSGGLRRFRRHCF